MGGLDPPTQWRRGTQRAPTRAGWVARSSRAMVSCWKRKPGLTTSPWAGLTRPPSVGAGLIARRRARLGGAVKPRHGEGLNVATRTQNLTMGGPDPPTQWRRGADRAPTRVGPAMAKIQNEAETKFDKREQFGYKNRLRNPPGRPARVPAPCPPQPLRRRDVRRAEILRVRMQDSLLFPVLRLDCASRDCRKRCGRRLSCSAQMASAESFPVKIPVTREF
jgi:hypothetical protein